MTSKDFEIRDIEPILLQVPFHPRCAKVKEVRVPFWSMVDVCKITLACGVEGIGETLTQYTWGQSDEAQFNRVRGKNLFDHLWDDSLGAGLQMALFDAAGKAMDVPCHKLMGCSIGRHARSPGGLRIGRLRNGLQRLRQRKHRDLPQ